ncbi:hypothetical protein [Leifsonia xyli]|uniref:hypothetical protein n=1 Tax=Leifsonia xyli TaxID=1575 RepID=UPI003D67120E
MKDSFIRVYTAAGERVYRVLDTEDNPVNGFQAMAVAPVVHGVVDEDHIVIAYAGTNPDHRADLMEDVETVVGGQQGVGSQVLDALFFAERVRVKHQGSSITTAGHSLGGLLALLVAGENDWDSTTFNAPDPYDHLSPQARNRIAADAKAGRSRLHNYVNVWDVVGNIFGNRTGAAIYVGDRPGRPTLEYHNLGKNGAFTPNPDGSIEGAGVKGHSLEDIIANVVDEVIPGASAALPLGISMLAGIARSPAAMRSLAKNAAGALVAVNTASALGLAASIGNTGLALAQIKLANGRIVPRMEEGLVAAKNAATALPYVTAYDIESCVEGNRLRVDLNVDEHAVREVDRLVDHHVDRVGQLREGITRSVLHTVEQDARWALSFGLAG